MRRRFHLWRTGDLKDLVALWTRDRLMVDLKLQKPLDSAASVRQALKLIEDGSLSKAMVYLGENGLGDMSLHQIKAQLQRKHPQQRRDWNSCGVGDMPRLVLGSARTALKNLVRNAGVGADRFRNEYLLRLVRGEMDSASRTAVLDAFEKFADRVVNLDFPPWFYLVWTTTVQFAPIKEAGLTPAQAEVRPVGCGAAVRRAMMRMVKETQHEFLRNHCEPVQLGQGTSGGTQAIGIGFQMHASTYRTHIIVVDDLINAFNEYERGSAFELCMTTPELHHLARLFEGEFRPRSHIYALVNGHLDLMEYRSVQGGQQGAMSASMGHNIVTLPFFKEVNLAVQADGGCARAIMDDLVVAGDPAAVWPALAVLHAGLDRIGLRKHATKPSVYSLSGQYGDIPPGYRVGSNGGGDTGLELGLGVVVAGCPVGDAIFTRNFVAAAVGHVCGVIDSTQNLLQLSSKARDHAFHVDRLSLSHRLDYLSQVVAPDVPGVLDLLQKADDHRLASLMRTIHISPTDPAPHIADPDFVRDRSLLPVRLRGLGLVRSADIAPAAFIGSMELVVPRFPDSTDAFGNIVPGLFPHLSTVTGNSFASELGRWTTLLASELPLGRSFAYAWEHMRLECGPQHVFAPPAADAPGRCRPEDVLLPGDTKPRLQRRCTRERARVRAEQLHRRADALPLQDQRGVAHHFATNGALFATLPQASTSCSGDEFTGAIAVYLGLPDPLVTAAIETRGEFFQDARFLRPLDCYGNSLSMYMGKGHGRTTFHNEVQAELGFLAKNAGLQIRQVPGDLFLAAIAPRSRENYLRQVQQQLRQHSGTCRGGLVPDLFNGRKRQMYDVKTTGFKPEEYLARRSVVDEKASTVPPQYRRRAAATDQQFNATPIGTVGPVETLLATMPVVECLSVGAFGESNRSMSTFLNDIAETGSDRPELFGCCHGKIQARGVIAQWATRRIGRVMLRGVVRVRHMALTASAALEAGAGQPPQHTGSTGATWNEWDSGNRSWVPQSS